MGFGFKINMKPNSVHGNCLERMTNAAVISRTSIHILVSK